MIAVRVFADDEDERMQLLAEERLAHGNMRLIWYDVTQQRNISFVKGVSCGPANSLRIFLRFLRTGEAAGERTFHLEDRKRFMEMANSFGFMDDEDAMYVSLIGKAGEQMKENVEKIWWPNVIDVEPYSSLRRRKVSVQQPSPPPPLPLGL